MNLDQNGFDPSKPSIQSNVVRKLPLPKCGVMSRGTFGIEENCTIVVKECACSPFSCLMSRGGRQLRCNSVDGLGLTLSNMICLESLGSCEEPKGSSLEERVTFEKWLEDNRKVRSIILASMTNKIQKQYDSLDDVPSIMLRMKEVYAVPDRHIRSTTKAFFGTKMTEVCADGIDREASISKVKSKRAGHWNRKKGKGKAVTATSSADGAPTASKGKGKGKDGGYQQSKANDICTHCQGKGHWKRECPQLLSNPGLFLIEVNMIANAASWVLDTSCGAHICNDLQVLERSRRLSKDEIILMLGDGNVVAAEVVGSLSLVISDHIQIELQACYYVPSMIKNTISIPVLDNDGYVFAINKDFGKFKE
ncbi:UNVERIFIED_CONTAM: hypothetical protein Scaly_2432200 [Sesamum calycinum]|uniref:CCHC-type domain-containing protein n=1 Tax=Sesamum calycinum TaxID=2727403 RepID=A0AAW2M2F2_9LAMI